MTPERCERELHDMATRTSPIVRFMLQKLAEAGCAIDARFFSVETCDRSVVGGFRPPDGVVMCHNQIHDRTTMENMLAHELTGNWRERLERLVRGQAHERRLSWRGTHS